MHLIFPINSLIVLIGVPFHFTSLGAGDCFTAAFAVALLEGKSHQEAMRFASAAAALCIQVRPPCHLLCPAPCGFALLSLRPKPALLGAPVSRALCSPPMHAEAPFAPIDCCCAPPYRARRWRERCPACPAGTTWTQRWQRSKVLARHRRCGQRAGQPPKRDRPICYKLLVSHT